MSTDRRSFLKGIGAIVAGGAAMVGMSKVKAETPKPRADPDALRIDAPLVPPGGFAMYATTTNLPECVLARMNQR